MSILPSIKQVSNLPNGIQIFLTNKVKSFIVHVLQKIECMPQGFPPFLSDFIVLLDTVMELELYSFIKILFLQQEILLAEAPIVVHLLHDLIPVIPIHILALIYSHLIVVLGVGP